MADTIGELGLFYALAPVAVIGGSLVARGGQNPVEAIKLGAAVLTGPNWQNFRDSYAELLKAGGAKEVDDADSLGGGGARTAARRRRARRHDGAGRGRHRRHERRAAAHACGARRLFAAEGDASTMRLQTPSWWYRKQGVHGVGAGAAGRALWAHRRGAHGQGGVISLAVAGDLHRQFHRGRRRQDADGHRRRHSV